MDNLRGNGSILCQFYFYKKIGYFISIKFYQGVITYGVSACVLCSCIWLLKQVYTISGITDELTVIGYAALNVFVHAGTSSQPDSDTADQLAVITQVFYH